MALGAGEHRIRGLTADEVLRMVELGVLDEPQRAELLDGVLVEKPVKSPAHEAVKTRLATWLWPGVEAGRHLVRTDAPLIVPYRTSMPEPDVAVVEPREYLAHHPTRALLVVEIALSSPSLDLEFKPALYAAAGVPDYWVVDLARRRLEAFSEPRRSQYGRREAVEPPAQLAAQAVDVEPLDLAGLLTGL